MRFRNQIAWVVVLVSLLLFASLANAQAPQSLRDSVTEAWMKSLMSMHEEGFRLDRHEGKLLLVWAPAGNSAAFDMQVPVTKETIAVFHTHSGSLNYKPSPQDIQTAKAAGIAVYVISEHAVWVADGSGVVKKFADR